MHILGAGPKCEHEVELCHICTFTHSWTVISQNDFSTSVLVAIYHTRSGVDVQTCVRSELRIFPVLEHWVSNQIRDAQCTPKRKLLL